MLRIGLKFPCNGLNGVRKHGYYKFNVTSRHYETRARLRQEQDGRFRRDKFLFKSHGARYSTRAPERSRGFAIPLVLGTISIGTGVLAYAKYDPQFRATLQEWVPGTDKAIEIIFLESILKDTESSDKDANTRLLFDRNALRPKEKSGQVEYAIVDTPKAEIPKSKSSKPAVAQLVEKKDVPSKEPSKEIRVSKEEQKVPIKTVVDESIASPSLEDASHKGVVELESGCAIATAKAVGAYNEAVKLTEKYNQYVLDLVETIGTSADRGLWQRLKDATTTKKEILAKLEKESEAALSSVKNLSRLIEEKRFELAPNMVDTTLRNIRKMAEDVENAKSKYESCLKMGNLMEEYWSNIKTAREAFDDELRILFPHLKIEDKEPVGDNAFDLFILYTHKKISNLQKELEKTRIREGLQFDLDSPSGISGKGAKTLLDPRSQYERNALQEEFDKKLLEEQKNCAEKLRQQLKLQLQIHNDHLREVVAEKEREHQNQLNRVVSEETLKVHAKQDMKFATVVGRIRALETTLKDVLEEERKATNLQILWSSCQALVRALKHGPAGVPPEESVKPLEPMIKAISKAAPTDDPLLKAAIDSIPEVASKRGVYPETALRQRFRKVEDVARRLAMVPAEGASLPIYFLSYLQSLLIMNSGYSISKSELQDAPIDPESLNTYEILNRARYWIDQGDFKMTLRYMNLLKGAPRSIAREWMDEVRLLLETQQAVSIFNAYAAALGLTFISGDAAKATQK